MMKLQNTVFKKCAVVTLLLGAGFNGFAQQEPTDKKPVTIDSFDVVRDYKPILADAVKIRRSPDMTNKRSYMPKLTYGNVVDKKLDINTGLYKLDVKETPFSQINDQTSNYVKLGIGNFNTILGEGYFSYDQYENVRIGGFVKHLSQKGDIENQRFSKQEVGVFGRRVYDAFTVDGLVGYNRYATRFYGNPLDVNGVSLNPDPEKQAFNDIYFTGELTSNYDANNENALSYSAKADAYTYKDQFAAKENSIALSGYLNKRMRAFNIGANLSVDVNSINGTDNVDGKTKNSVASINPYISFKGDNYVITLGANLVSEFGDSSRFNVFPSAEVDFSLVPEYIHLFGGVNGNVKKASLRSFTNQNPYLSPDLSMINTIERLNFFGGIKGNAGATFGYKVQVMYKQIEGLPLFVNNRETPYRFDLVYDGLGEDAAKYFGLQGEINIRLSDVVNLGGRLNIDQYTMQQEEEAWHMPKMKLAANARFNISEKLYIDAEALFQGDTYAREYTYTVNGSTVDISQGYKKVTLPSFFDLNAGAEYRATKHLGIFVKANNIFNKEYQRYQYYPRLGFNILGGLNYSF
ncbi:Outer membrane receptor for ferrienterochelin and colicins [Sphingobacterium spiritivorum]|uniref:Outer membrane receptor for ferrienterochelin and colicins n=1 Tax=Sphingobacterium spiritivorum TaxID=258 RepID=A0A380B9Y2_SPHSI|nr:TonB-dependent receptor [Sphingobacterium spiritivorum]SUI96953.1 Outer membrane receptor for ferrienterochelin and colicins [Sphingobacterium spiritivorum]